MHINLELIICLKLRERKFKKISGTSSLITFALQNPVKTRDASKLIFEINCGDNIISVQAQMFWITANLAFSENNSVRLAVTEGITSIDLLHISSWTQARKVTDIRIDFGSPNTCPALKINSVKLGKSIV